LKLADISGTKTRNIKKLKSRNLKVTVRKKNIKGLYRGISDFKKGYQLGINILKDEKGDLVADSYSIWARWRNHFYQLLNIQRDNDVRQTEIHTAEQPMPDPSAVEVELAIERVKSHKSPGIDQIPEELIKA